MIKKRTTTYPQRRAKSGQTLTSDVWKRNTSLTSFSAITKGLKFINSRSIEETPSNGKIAPERNNKTLPSEIEPRIPVSSEVKR